MFQKWTTSPGKINDCSGEVVTLCEKDGDCHLLNPAHIQEIEGPLDPATAVDIEIDDEIHADDTSFIESHINDVQLRRIEIMLAKLYNMFRVPIEAILPEAKRRRLEELSALILQSLSQEAMELEYSTTIVEQLEKIRNKSKPWQQKI